MRVINIFISALLVVGISADDVNRDPPPAPIRALDQTNDVADTSIPVPAAPVGPLVPKKPEAPPPANETGFLDSMMGHGAQSRIVSSVTGWVSDKVKTNPGCVERFVCETYRTGETMTGVPYFIMQVTNAAVSFMVADMFDEAINMKEITRAARYGRTVGSCDTMKCEIMDGQLRTLGDFLGSFEDFLTSIYSSVSNSINIG